MNIKNYKNIIINNNKEWLSCQKLLFSIGYEWISSGRKVFKPDLMKDMINFYFIYINLQHHKKKFTYIKSYKEKKEIYKRMNLIYDHTIYDHIEFKNFEKLVINNDLDKFLDKLFDNEFLSI